MREMLLRGDWCTTAPYGYDSIRKNGKRTIVINERGKLLRRAFEWKAEEHLSNEAILKRLASNGITLYKQKLAHIFRNPFYAGFIAHNLLDGAVVKGNHEALISQELFLRVNGLMDNNTHGYKVQEENDHLPLKRFLRCGKCDQMLHGYVVKKKGIHYYKCSTVGCGTNRNANVLNNRFAEVLEVLKLDVGKDVLKLIKQQAIATFNQFTKGYEDGYSVLQKKHKELTTKIARLEERFIEEDITSELY
ncbi:recombinase family protein [Mucilaginibacter sp. HMF5004]|uniref:recombinase family protein n=1 Tax=Mucilaginibacter rivuli TaxID=2857527 RepID=UPI001C5D06A4|nr:recombinase family protein [Mucilaginibacter rivuli]MBW4888452.1 recombinase family protein [Mucilaginibacter rivuli]